MTQYNSISVQESCCIQQHEIRSFFEKSSFFSSQHRPSKKLGAESHVCKLSETKFKALNQLKKKKTSCSSCSKTKKNVFSIRTKNYSEKKPLRRAGIRTPVSNVSGWDTRHYTTEYTLPRITSKFMSFEILKLQNDTIQLDQRSGILLYTAT